MAKPKPTNYLGAWRQFRGLTLEQLAAGARTTKGQVSRLESGQRGLTVPWLRRLASALDTTADKLLQPPGTAPDDREITPAQMVPLLDSVRAGHWTEVTDPHPVVEHVPTWRKVGPRAFALRIEGDSMLPEFREGDVIIVDPDMEAVPGRYVVAKLERDQQATFKRYRLKSAGRPGQQVVELVPLNSDWPTLTITSDNRGHIVGVAVDHYRKLV
ncbi:helix-turn-helix domain-containing protein [Vineibacter terrae]|nr:LexA family transcriptional regulator [Vineibacter terrae]